MRVPWKCLATVVVTGSLVAGCGPAGLPSEPSAPSVPAASLPFPAAPPAPSGPSTAPSRLGKLTVHGQLLDNSGNPLAGRVLLIVGHSTTRTDLDGRFTMRDVTPPYDVVVFDDRSGTATIYSQLTRMDPRLPGFGPGGVPRPGESTASAELSGTIQGGAPLPNPHGTVTGISWGSPGLTMATWVAQTPYRFPLYWWGPPTITGTVHALQWTTDGDLATGYLGYGERAGISVGAGAKVGGADLVLTAPQVTTVSGTVVPPAGFKMWGRTFDLTFDDGADFLVGGDSLPDFDFRVLVPAGIGAAVRLKAWATYTEDYERSLYLLTTDQLTGIAPGTSDARLELPVPSVPVSPPDGASGVDDSTDLAWSGVPDAIYEVIVGGPDGRSYLLVSGTTRARIPELPQHWGLLPGGHYSWNVLALGPYPGGIDGFAAGGPLAPRFVTLSPGRAFTAR